jgi:Tol biopolymer transport system component
MRALLALILSTTVPIPTNGVADRPSISAGGRYVAYDSSSGVYLHDRQTGATEQISPDGLFPSVSDDGRFVAFMSSASDLVPGDTNGVTDIFVRDRLDATLRRVSVGGNGRQANGFSQMPRVSGNGRYVMFSSAATNLVGGDRNGVRDVFVHDLITGRTTPAASPATVATSGT